MSALYSKSKLRIIVGRRLSRPRGLLVSLLLLRRRGYGVR